MTVTLVGAPHPDDETLGCGGTLLKLAASGAEVHWMIMSTMTSNMFSSERMAERQIEIREVAAAYRFAETHELRFCPCGLSFGQVLGDLVLRSLLRSDVPSRPD